MKHLYLRALRSSLIGTVIFLALIFIPAGTLYYWQGWLFMAIFVAGTIVVTTYLAIYDPKLLERRMRAGPGAEKQRAQKIIMAITFVGFAAIPVVSALDHRFGWSGVSPTISLIGDALVCLSYVLIFFVFRQNSFAASTIQVVEGQKVVSSGFYAFVRHPMYAGALPMLFGAPLALGSFYGVIVVVVFFPVIVWRLLNEENYLHKHLSGYTEYTRTVRWRLLPGIF